MIGHRKIIMIKSRLIIITLSLAAIVIIAMAAFIGTHFGSMSLLEELFLIGIGILTLFLIMFILFVIVRSAANK